MRTLQISLVALILASSWGCTTATTTNTARSSTEQLLIANAVDQSLDKMDFTPFRGANVFLNDKYVDCTDKTYVIASVRHRILQAGGRLVDSADKSDLVVEVRSGAVGTKSSDAFVGVPEIVLPGVVTLPEVRIAERKSQLGIAKLGIVAYETKTGQALGTGGMALAQSQDNNWYVAGAGPFRSGSVREEINKRTSGASALKYTQIADVVAFQPVPQAPAEQLAQESESPQPIDPVSLEKTAEAPEWVKPSN